MITVTQKAVEKLAAYLLENNIDSATRITVANNCRSISLGLALDECKENDFTLEKGEFTLLLAQDLADECGRVSVDYFEQSSGYWCGERGFSISSEKPLPGVTRSCGSSCGGGSCGC